jgi:hypothetical protein
MAEYNFQPNLLGNNAGDESSAFDSAPFEFAPFGLTPFSPVMGELADWMPPGSQPLGVVGGDTAAQPLLPLEPATFVTAGSGRRVFFFFSFHIANI